MVPSLVAIGSELPNQPRDDTSVDVRADAGEQSSKYDLIARDITTSSYTPYALYTLLLVSFNMLLAPYSSSVYH